MKIEREGASDPFHMKQFRADPWKMGEREVGEWGLGMVVGSGGDWWCGAAAGGGRRAESGARVSAVFMVEAEN